jgi:cardiolipin synthase (CMP-forming)
VARELAVVALARVGLSRGMELRINWPGRLAVWPIMSAIFFALLDLRTLGAILLYVGLALALVATAMYLRDGLDQMRRKTPPTPSS